MASWIAEGDRGAFWGMVLKNGHKTRISQLGTWVFAADTTCVRLHGFDTRKLTSFGAFPPPVSSLMGGAGKLGGPERRASCGELEGSWEDLLRVLF